MKKYKNKKFSAHQIAEIEFKGDNTMTVKMENTDKFFQVIRSLEHEINSQMEQAKVYTDIESINTYVFEVNPDQPYCKDINLYTDDGKVGLFYTTYVTRSV